MAVLSKSEYILLWSANIWFVGWGMFGPLFAVFAGKIGADVFTISWVYAGFLALTGLGSMYVGRLADRVGHEWLLVLGYALSAVGAFGYVWVDSVFSLAVVQIVMAIATVLSTPTWFALYDLHSGDGSKDGRVWGLFSGLGYCMQAIGLMLGGYVVTQYSWDVLFVCMGLLLLLSTVYQAQILRYRVTIQRNTGN
jgi:MFS family permease